MAAACEHKLCEDCTRLLAREREEAENWRATAIKTLASLRLDVANKDWQLEELRKEVSRLSKKLGDVRKVVNC